jgi:hypothetical protein
MGMTERIRQLIESRLKQHRDNLAGWKEGDRCACVGTAGREMELEYLKQELSL